MEVIMKKIFITILCGLSSLVIGSEEQQMPSVDLAQIALAYCTCIRKGIRKDFAKDVCNKIITKKPVLSQTEPLEYVSFCSGSLKQDCWGCKELLRAGYSLNISLIDRVYQNHTVAGVYLKKFANYLESKKIRDDQEINIEFFDSTENFLKYKGSNYKADILIMVDPCAMAGESKFHDQHGNHVQLEKNNIYLLVTDQDRRIYSKEDSTVNRDLYDAIHAYLKNPSPELLAAMRYYVPVAIHHDPYVEFVNLVQKIADPSTVVMSLFKERRQFKPTTQSNFERIDQVFTHKYLQRLGYKSGESEIIVLDLSINQRAQLYRAYIMRIYDQLARRYTIKDSVRPLILIGIGLAIGKYVNSWQQAHHKRII